MTQAEEQNLGSGAMFDSIAHRYDAVNRVLSLGTDQSWRRKTVKALQLGTQGRVLDLATGTADVALEILKQHPDATVIGVDPSAEMLKIGKKKVAQAGLEPNISFVNGAAEALDFPDATFDGVTMAFGIRNAADRPRALREMLRVTKPGGRVAILELNEPEHGVLAPMARWHIRKVVPFLGGLLSGKQQYRYLQDSIADFPPADEFQAMMADAGFANEAALPILFGVAHVFIGTRPQTP